MLSARFMKNKWNLYTWNLLKIARHVSNLLQTNWNIETKTYQIGGKYKYNIELKQSKYFSKKIGIHRITKNKYISISF